MGFQDRVNQLDAAMNNINHAGWVYFLLMLACVLFALCLPKKAMGFSFVPMALISIPMFPVYFGAIATMRTNFGGLFELAASWAWSGPEYLGTFFFSVWPFVAGVAVLGVVRIHSWKVDSHENLLREGDRLAAMADHALER